jgi:hypothetical protein
MRNRAFFSGISLARSYEPTERLSNSKAELKHRTRKKLRSRSCIIDGEAVACGHDCILRSRIRHSHHDAALDLIELNGDDLPCDPVDTSPELLEAA